MMINRTQDQRFEGAVRPEWSAEHVIRSYEVDPQGLARLPIFCCFMQEAAYAHAEHFGLGHTQLAPRNMSWVLSRMRIEVERRPRWGETVRLRTWPSGRDRLFYTRDFQITNDAGDLLLLASTAWFVIDLGQRERVLPDWWSGCDLPIGPPVFSAKLKRLKQCACVEGTVQTVNYGDLDQNGHVSNIRYVEWMLNHLPQEFHQRHMLRSLEVNYLNEAVCGHEISICEQVEGLSIGHSIRADGRDLCRGRSVWITR